MKKSYNVLIDGQKVNMPYHCICEHLGFIPEVKFIKITGQGTITFTCGTPDEARELYRSCLRHGFKPAHSLIDALGEYRPDADSDRRFVSREIREHNPDVQQIIAEVVNVPMMGFIMFCTVAFANGETTHFYFPTCDLYELSFEFRNRTLRDVIAQSFVKLGRISEVCADWF